MSFTLAALAASFLAAVSLVAIGASAAAAGLYVNPTPAEIHAKLHAAAVARSIPPKLLYAIAFQESTWRQFDADGDPLIGSDGLGLGIMQVTSYGSYDVERLRTDIDYNIAAGADILVSKWGYAPLVIPVVGDGNPRCYENWFYAVWAYNGWTANNPYPYQIWTHAAVGPEGWWAGLPVTPVPRSVLVNGFGVTVPTPLPAHYWSEGLPKPALGAPQVKKRVAAGVRFTVSGTLSPQHPAGATSVEIRCYRQTGKTWVLRRTVLTVNENAGDATRYVALFALGKSGKWKLSAYAPADADHAPVSAPAAYVTVR